MERLLSWLASWWFIAGATAGLAVALLVQIRDWSTVHLRWGVLACALGAVAELPSMRLRRQSEDVDRVFYFVHERWIEERLQQYERGRFGQRTVIRRRRGTINVGSPPIGGGLGSDVEIQQALLPGLSSDFDRLHNLLRRRRRLRSFLLEPGMAGGARPEQDGYYETSIHSEEMDWENLLSVTSKLSTLLRVDTTALDLRLDLEGGALTEDAKRLHGRAIAMGYLTVPKGGRDYYRLEVYAIYNYR